MCMYKNVSSRLLLFNQKNRGLNKFNLEKNLDRKVNLNISKH